MVDLPCARGSWLVHAFGILAERPSTPRKEIKNKNNKRVAICFLTCGWGLFAVDPLEGVKSKPN